MQELSLDKLQVIMNLVFSEKKDDEQQLGAHFKTVDKNQQADAKKRIKVGKDFRSCSATNPFFFQRPQPKFDAYTLIGPKGLPALKTAFEGCKYNPKADPVSLYQFFFKEKRYKHFWILYSRIN